MVTNRVFTASALLLFLILLPSCVVIPTKMPTKVRGGVGIDLAKDAIRVDHIVVGISTREQVKQEFSSIDTGFDQPRLFWGRWVSSSFGVIAGMMWGFGPGEQADGSSRLWHTFDLFVTFDEKGVVVEKKVFQDKHAELWQELRTETKDLVLPPYSETIVTEPGEDEQTQAFFTPKEVQFSGEGKRRGAVMKYGTDLRIEISEDFQPKCVARPNLLCYLGRFSDRQSGTHRKNHFCLESARLGYLVRYLDQSGTQVLLKK